MAQADRAAIARNVLDLDRLTPHCGAEVRDIDLSARLGDAQIAAPREVRTTQLRDVMTADSQTVAPEESLGYALLLMHENGLRHLPVFEDGVAIGILSARNALDPELEEFESESRRREDLRRKARSAGAPPTPTERPAGEDAIFAHPDPRANKEGACPKPVPASRRSRWSIAILPR